MRAPPPRAPSVPPLAYRELTPHQQIDITDPGHACRLASGWCALCRVRRTRRFRQNQPIYLSLVPPPSPQVLLLVPALVQGAQGLGRNPLAAGQDYVNAAGATPALEVLDQIRSMP